MPRFTTPTPRGASPPAAVAAPPPRPGRAAPRSVPRTELFDCVAGEGSGLYMRRLLHAGFTDADEILAAVHRQFPGSKATKSDVGYNKNKLNKEGPPPPIGGMTVKVTNLTGAAVVKSTRAAPLKTPSQPDLPWEPNADLAKAVVAKAKETQRAPSDGVPTALANAVKSAGYRIDFARAGGEHVTLALTLVGQKGKRF